MQQLSYQCLKTNRPCGYTFHECVQFFFRLNKGLLKAHGTNSLFKRFSGFYRVIFTESAPLGRFSHRVAMSLCLSVCLSEVLRHRVQFFLGLSLALMSHDQFQASHWSSIPPSFVNLENWKLRNSVTQKLGNPETR